MIRCTCGLKFLIGVLKTYSCRPIKVLGINRSLYHRCVIAGVKLIVAS